MFDRRDDPDHLLSSLEAFLRIWHGPESAWYGIAAEKLAQTSLPEPLRRLYAFAGYWPGNNFWHSLFAFQDCLVPFELLAMHGGKLVFAWENQGGWACGTTPDGADPPVWVSVDDSGWQPLCQSLGQFLVTLCLQETLFGCKYIAPGKQVMQALLAQGRHISPLWLDGPFVDLLDANRRGKKSFHLVDRHLLVMDGEWCGTDSEELRLALPQVFREPVASQREVASLMVPAIPKAGRRFQLEAIARQHEELAGFHSRRAAAYRSAAASLRW
jgi:hypothetical protein